MIFIVAVSGVGVISAECALGSLICMVTIPIVGHFIRELAAMIPVWLSALAGVQLVCRNLTNYTLPCFSGLITTWSSRMHSERN